MHDKLSHYINAWHLSDPQPLAITATSHLYLVYSGDDQAVLKILTELGTEEAKGALALRYFDGHGAVRLLRSDDGAHLLEYARGENLVAQVVEGKDEQAATIIGDVLNQLHTVSAAPVPDELTPLKVWFRVLFGKAVLDKNKGIDSIYTRAAPLAEYLLNQNREVRVLHGDIHHENIRQHPTRGWLAFDPKGLVGERTFDAANTLCNPWNMQDVVHSETRLLTISGILAEKLRVDHTRLLAFVYIYACLSASWIASDDADASHPLTVASLVEPHIGHLLDESVTI